MKALTRTFENLRGDRAIWFLVILLGFCSILAVYSAVGSMAYKVRGGNTEYYLVQQILFISAGFVFMYLSYKFNYMVYARLAPILFLIAIPLLFYTIGFGTEINDAKRWITIPWIDKTFQTSDLARLALIIFIAKAIARKQDVIKDFKSAFLPIIIPIILVCMLIAPADLSTAALLFVTCMIMMVVGRVSLRYIMLLVIGGMLAFLLLLAIGSFFPDFVRVETWISRINDFIYDADGGWQIQQSKIAIANGEFFGLGPGNSMQRNYLPYPYADFIYAIICEEYGLLGAITVLGIYVALLYRCVCIVTKCPKTFGAILAIGLCLNIVVQAFANIAVSVHLVPVTGLTLPIISMGGTSVVFTCISLGIILSISKYVEEYSNYEILEEEAAVADVESQIVSSKRPRYENYY